MWRGAGDPIQVVACGGGEKLNTEEVEKDMKELTARDGGVETAAECPDEVSNEEGETYECDVTYAGNENNKQNVEVKVAADDRSELTNPKLVEDESAIRQIVPQVDAKPELICEVVTEEILEELEGEDCPTAAQEGNDGEPAVVKSIKVEGDTATMVTDESTTTFERAEDGGWVVTALGG